MPKFNLRRVCRRLAGTSLVVVYLVSGLSYFVRAQDGPPSAARPEGYAASREEREQALARLSNEAEAQIAAGGKLEAARVLIRVGHLRLLLNRPGDAVVTYERVPGLLGAETDLETRIDGLNGLGAAYLVQQKLGIAESAVNRSLSLISSPDYPRGRAEALLTLGDVQNYRDHNLGLTTAKSALAIWQTLNDQAGLGKSYALVGRCYMALNLLPEAIENYHTALETWNQLHDAKEQAGALVMLAFISIRQGENDQSISLLTEAQGLVDENDEPERAGQVAAGLAEAYNDNGLPEVGLTHYQHALSAYQRTQDPHLVWYATWGIGNSYLLLGDYENAIRSYQQSLEGVGPRGIEAAQSNHYLGRAFSLLGQDENALSHLQTSLDIYRHSANRLEITQIQALLGQIAEHQGKPEAAARYYQQAISSFVQMADGPNEAATRFAFGRMKLRQGDLIEAEKYLGRAIELTEVRRQSSNGTDLAAAFSASVFERYEDYIECLMRLNRDGPAVALVQHALQISEMMHSRSLSELLQKTRTDLFAGIDPDLASRERTQRLALKTNEDLKTRLLARTYTKEELAAIDVELQQMKADYERTLEAIRSRFPAFRQIVQPETLGLAQIKQQVVADDQTVLLEYSIGDEKSYVWAVTRDGFKSFELPGRAEITAAAKAVNEGNSSRPDAGGDGDAARRELARLILAPVAAELNKKRLIIVADGILNYIPFQSLPDPAQPDQPLVARYEIVNAPSASILGELRQEAVTRTRPSKLLAAFGDAAFAPNPEGTGTEAPASQQASLTDSDRWRSAQRDIEPNGDDPNLQTVEPLIYAKYEMANLRELAGSQSLVASQYSASRDNLLHTDLTQYSILHFATHGIMDPVKPEKSGLLLSQIDRNGKRQDAFVGLQDIYSLRAPVSLVVLSACRTGLGKDVKGEGLIGLTRGFMYAGASTVVASLWKVDDEATSELMKEFYLNLLQRGMPPAEALRAAQNNIRQRPGWSSPYFWAAFTVQGEYRNAIRPARVPGTQGLAQRLGITFAILVVFAGLAYTNRRRTAVHS